MNAANYFKDERRPVSRLSTFMFNKTPCIVHFSKKLVMYILTLFSGTVQQGLI